MNSGVACNDWSKQLAKPTDGNGRRGRSSNGESPDWNPPLAQLDQLLDEGEFGEEDDSRISIVLPPPPAPPQRSMRPARLGLRILEALPPWGRVAVVLALIVAAMVAKHLGWW